MQDCVVRAAVSVVQSVVWRGLMQSSVSSRVCVVAGVVWSDRWICMRTRCMCTGVVVVVVAAAAAVAAGGGGGVSINRCLPRSCLGHEYFLC